MFGVQYSGVPGIPGQQMPGGYMDPYTARLAALQQPQMQPAQSYDIITVHGEPGARAFRMAPNSRCLLLDDTEPLLWLAQSDGAGYMTCTPYSIKPYEAKAQIGNDQDTNNKISVLEKEVAEIKKIIYATGYSNTSKEEPLAGSSVPVTNVTNA